MLTSALKNPLPMTDDTWRRHANPWSVYTRFLSLPLLALAVWSRVWIGWWSLIPIALTIVWIIINPRLFPVPASTDNWASKAVLGERVWLRRKTTPIPNHHSWAAMLLAIASGIGALQVAYGLYALDSVMLSYGMLLTVMSKAWFLDRMVWLFEDMMHTAAEYRNWLY